MRLNDTKRIFFAFKVLAPWLKHGEGKKIIKKEMRHITLSFLGQTDWGKLKSEIPLIEKSFSLDFSIYGFFDSLIPLPPFKSRVLALNPIFVENETKVKHLQKSLEEKLLELEFLKEVNQDWLPHVSLVRSPYNFFSWKKNFHLIPFIAENLTIYESMGNLKYKSLYEIPIPKPYIIHRDENLITLCSKTACLEFVNFHLLLAVSIELNLPFPLNIQLPFIDDLEFEKAISACLTKCKKVAKFEVDLLSPDINKRISIHTT